MVKKLECAEGLRFSMMEIEDERKHMGAALGVGINRRGVVNERVIRERNSETILTRAMRGRQTTPHLKGLALQWLGRGFGLWDSRAL